MKMDDQILTTSDPNSTPAAPPPPPPPHRRPRVREVSSRFMSPVASSSSSSCCGDPHLVSAKSPLHKPNHHHHQRHHRRHQDEKESDHLMSSTDENRPIETARSLESPFHFQRRSQHQQPRSVMKLFSENGGKRCSRPDTPRLTTPTPTLTTASSKPNRLVQRSTSNTTSATKLLQSLSAHQPSSQEDTDSVTSDDTCSQNSLDADMLASVSAGLLSERNGSNINRVNGNVASTPFSRSLNLSLSASQQSMFSSRGSEKTSALSRSFSNSLKIGGLSLPPVPPASVKPGADAKKGGKKASSQQEDVHALKMLHNRYLQWRFANAKAEASGQAQRRETERMLYSLGLKISDLYDSVKRKRIELGLLQSMKTLSAIVEAQMPYLDEWNAFEGDYSVSLSEIIQALLNTSLQLPVGGNVKADVRDIGDALNSAAKLMEIIISHIQSFLPKANEMEMLVSELAKVTGGEKALIEECGVLLSKTHAFQVEECYLRGQIMQQFNQRPRAPGKFHEDANISSLNAVHMR